MRILAKVMVHLRDGLQWIQQFAILPGLRQSSETFDTSDQHMQMVERRDGRCEIAFGAVQLLNVACDLLDHVFRVLGALFDFADLAKQLANHLWKQNEKNNFQFENKKKTVLTIKQFLL